MKTIKDLYLIIMVVLIILICCNTCYSYMSDGTQKIFKFKLTDKNGEVKYAEYNEIINIADITSIDSIIFNYVEFSAPLYSPYLIITSVFDGKVYNTINNTILYNTKIRQPIKELIENNYQILSSITGQGIRLYIVFLSADNLQNEYNRQQSINNNNSTFLLCYTLAILNGEYPEAAKIKCSKI